MGNKRKIPDKLRHIATIRERKARADASRAARRVSSTQEELTAIRAEHIEAEAAVAGDDPVVDGATVQLLALGRQVRNHRVAAKTTELNARTSELSEREEEHRGQLRERHYKERLYEHWRDVDRSDRDCDERKELDEVGAGSAELIVKGQGESD